MTPRRPVKPGVLERERRRQAAQGAEQRRAERERLAEIAGRMKPTERKRR
jgi:hypothetical protein